MEPLARVLRHFRRALDTPVSAGGAAERERHAVHAVHAVQAIDRYLAWADGYAAALTRKSAREAAWYRLTGEPASALVAGLAHLKSDETDARLRDYRAWLWELVKHGVYDGPTNLQRMRPDGSWEPLRLPGD